MSMSALFQEAKDSLDEIFGIGYADAVTIFTLSTGLSA